MASGKSKNGFSQKPINSFYPPYEMLEQSPCTSPQASPSLVKKGPFLQPHNLLQIPKQKFIPTKISNYSNVSLSIPLLERFSPKLAQKRCSSSPRTSDASNWSSDTSMTYLYEEDDAETAQNPVDMSAFSASTPKLTALLLSDAGKSLVKGRNSGHNGAGYMNLPSPNIQTDEGKELFKNAGASEFSFPQNQEPVEKEYVEIMSNPTNESGDMLPASAFSRRKAIIPPKMFTDRHHCEEPSDHDSAQSINSSENGAIGVGRSKRRSSIVVIPPMQICPGDLLVYSKVLTHKSNFSKKSAATELDASTQSLSVTDTGCACFIDTVNRKGRNKWSLMQLFDRSHRGKNDSLTGLEEVLSGLEPCEFEDEQLSRYKGMCWADFVTYKDDKILVKQRKESYNNESEDFISFEESISNFAYTKDITETKLVEKESKIKQMLLCLDRSRNAELQQKKLSRARILSSSFKETSSSTKRKQQLQQDGRSLFLSEKPKIVTDKSVGVDITPPTPMKKKNPLMRSKTELVLGKNKGSSGIFGIFGEKTHHFEKYPIRSAKKFDETANLIEEENISVSSPVIIETLPAFGENFSIESIDKPEEENGETCTPTIPAAKNELRRREAVWDLFQSECAFLYDHLMVLKNVYMEPLKRIQVDGFAMFAEPELLFGNLDELCCVTYAFCKEFIDLIEQHIAPGGNLDTTSVLVKLFQKGSKATMLCQAYHRYALNYINALNYLETLRRQLEFLELEKWCNRDPRCKKLQLTDLLVAPVQHIMKVPLILRDIETRTDNLEEKSAVKKIIDAEEHSLRELDDKMKWLKNFERLLEIQRNIFWPPITETDPKVYIPDFLKAALSKQPCEQLIVSPRRQIIIEGTLYLIDHSKPQEMYVVLFDDMLLITRRKKTLHKRKSALTENWGSSSTKSQSTGDTDMRYIVYKQPLSLDRFFLHDISAPETPTTKLESAFVLVNLNRFQQIVAVYTFQAQSEQKKHTWLVNLRDTQEKWKKTLQNTVFKDQHRLSVPTSSPPKPHPLDPRSFVQN